MVRDDRPQPFTHVCSAHISYLRAQELSKYNDSYFESEYWKEDIPGKTGNHNLTYNDPGHVRRFDFLASVLLQYCQGNMLDAGCGPGYLLERALDRGLSAQGVDASRAARNRFCARAGEKWGARFDIAQLNELPYGRDQFDTSICLDALEHLLVFDIFSAASELCRVTSRQLICSINSDNPYSFHPTILSADSWVALFESTEAVRLNAVETQALNAQIRERYPEYSMFVFHRVHRR